MKFYLSLHGIKDLLAGFDQQTVRTGLARGLNKLGDQVKTASKTSITKRYTIKASRVNQELTIPRSRRARASQLSVTLRARGKRIGLMQYRARWDPRKAGASAIIRRGRGRKVWPGTFIRAVHQIKGQEGMEHVFERKGKERLPLRRVTGPSVPQLFGSAKSTAERQHFITRKYNSVVMHEMIFAIQQKSRRTMGKAQRIASGSG